ncbi:GNAT family N-acetyltransferase [Arthrobacter sp. GMC3]|uniref:GNAT family N-acetyltransferase n=1 Tax=Arthrobacter sp. GMC3 TaxID=2058894 RepID=UPI000CE56F79|nr:GNAT family N-acetyltransferase [Arthrobacter sp. GMC3]
MFEIRPVALSEFSLLPSLEADADEAFGTLDPAVTFGDFPPPATAAEYAGAFHIMVAGRPPVGFVRLEIVDGNAHLEQLAVAPEYARRGVGRALVTAAKAWAQEAGFHTMTLCTFADVPFNAPFYASCGFLEVPPDALTPGLERLRAGEALAGLDSIGRRVVMRVSLHSRE